MKIVATVLRFLFGLWLLMPVAGALGVFPEPTAEMYPTEEAWLFMSAMMETGYMMYAIALLSVVCSVLFFMNRTALAALLLAPFTVNVMMFHWFLDASPVSQYSVMAYILLFFNAYFLWINKEKYKTLW